MGGFLRFLAWFALLVAGFVLVALPLLLGPLLASQLRDAGVRADSVNVGVALFDPGLVLARSRQLTLSATNVDMAPARIGSLNVALGNVNFLERTFETVTGELQDIALTMGSDTVTAESAAIDGPSDAATVTVHFAAAQVAQLLTVTAAHNGLKLDDVQVSDSGVTVKVSGVSASARLIVRAGALLLDPGIGGMVVLLQPTKNDSWRLTDAWFTTSGLNLAGTVNVAAIVHGMSAGNAQR